MLEMNASFFAVTGAAVLFAGVSKGGFGSGAAFASSAILALFLDPGVALGIMLPLLMLIDLATLRPYWKTWNWADARVLIAGAVPGVIIGAVLYRLSEPDVIRVAPVPLYNRFEDVFEFVSVLQQTLVADG